MCVDNIDIGRNRAIDILNMLNPKYGEVLYGQRNDGIGYCSFIFQHASIKYAATVRTSNNGYIKIDSRLIDTNVADCEEHDIEHVLILAFNWSTSKSIYLIHDIMQYMSHCTKGRQYKVFTKQYIEQIMRGVKYDVGDCCIELF